MAAEPGVKYAVLHYKTLELDKDRALRINSGNFDNNMCNSSESKQCTRWLKRTIEIANRPISFGPVNRQTETDSSLVGYRGHDVTFNIEFSGIWDEQDKQCHIKYLELKTTLLCLQYFCDNVTNVSFTFS